MTTTYGDDDDDARVPTQPWHSKRTNDEYTPNGPTPNDTFKTSQLFLFPNGPERIIVFKTAADVSHLHMTRHRRRLLNDDCAMMRALTT